VELLRFGLTVQLTTDLDLHKRALAALADGAIGISADDPGLLLSRKLQGIVVPRQLRPGEPGGPPEPSAETPGDAGAKGAAVPAVEKSKPRGPLVPLHKPVDPLLDVAKLTAVLAAVEGRNGAQSGLPPGAFVACAFVPHP
jgi:hypothetical protein